MSNWTYNTEHGSFLLKKEKIADAAKALNNLSLEVGLGHVNLEPSYNLTGDVIDIVLQSSNFGERQDDALKAIAPFVEPGSYLVFAFGGVEACWARAFEMTAGVVECKGADVVTVLDYDLKEMLDVLRVTVPTFYKVMLEKYAPKYIRDQLEEMEKSDG